MNLNLSETESLLQQTIRAYLNDNVTSSSIRELEGEVGFDVRTWEYLVADGFVDLAVPTSSGGAGGSLTELGVIVEECARRPATVPILETAACVTIAALYGVEEASHSIVEGVGNGTMTLAPAIPNGGVTSMPLISSGNVSGEVEFVDYAESVSHHLVAAMDDGQPGLFLVNKQESDSVSFDRLRNIAGTPQANVHYRRTAARRVTGADGYQFLRCLGQALAAVQCLGAAQRALDLTVDYVGSRTQFGRPIGSFQAVQHHVANMATMVMACRFLTYEALWKLDKQGITASRNVAVAKAWASKTSTEVPMMAHQLHGGIGVTLEYDLQLLSRRGKQRAVTWGTTEECLSVIGANLL